ncbi:MAG: TGS domain-containing protein [Candidatus Dojkabacteria bacterium]|nr:TGS domain-containing protein [Candidatus Dojkabacteria bacterium]MDQ7021141.1 TGS domain-containing protein [Candidatus Dojkabacteria bacterium]
MRLDSDFDDYIAKPKENGYKSIHTVIELEKDRFAEIQIRTHEMHEYNEFGPASHIAYKLQKASKGENFTWTKDLVAWQEEKTLSRESFKIKAFAESVFAFTPKGEVIMIPKGGTPLDFAFKVHTSIGQRYLGALVNGKMVKMSHEIKTGDIIEIKTGNKANVTKDWEKVVKSGEARRLIRRFLRLKK